MDKAVKWWQDFMQLWMVDTGYLTQEQMDAMNQTYQHYMPTQRERIGGAKTGKSDFFQVRAAVGSDLRIVNPLISIADYANSIVGMNLKNDAALEFHNAFQSTITYACHRIPFTISSFYILRYRYFSYIFINTFY